MIEQTMAKTRRQQRSRSNNRRHKRMTKRHSSNTNTKRRSRFNRRTRKGGSAKIDQTFVNDALPYGEYRTSKGIRSGFQIRK